MASDAHQFKSNMSDGNRIDYIVSNALSTAFNMCMYASYALLSVNSFFSRGKVALPGLASFFRRLSDEDFEASVMIAEYAAGRGAELEMNTVEKPLREDYGNALQVFVECVELTERMKQASERAHASASDANDVDAAEFLAQNQIQRLTQRLSTLQEMATRIQRAGPRIGVFLMDSQLMADAQAQSASSTSFTTSPDTFAHIL